MNRTAKNSKFKQTTAHVCLTHEAHREGNSLAFQKRKSESVGDRCNGKSKQLA